MARERWRSKYRTRKLNKKQKLSLLLRTRELIKQGFTSGTLRRKRSNTETGYAYCLLGAAEQAYREQFPSHVDDYFDGYLLEGGGLYPAVMKQLSVMDAALDRGYASCAHFNDASGKNAVIEVLDERINFYAEGKSK